VLCGGSSQLGSLWGCQQVWGSQELLEQLLQLSFLGLLASRLCLITVQMKLPEVDILYHGYVSVQSED